MRTLGYCEHCRKVKNVTISANNLIRNRLIGMCDDCAADHQPPTIRAARDRSDSVLPATAGGDNAARPDDRTPSPHPGAAPPRPARNPEDPPPQPHPHPQPTDRTLPASDSSNHSTRFDTAPSLDMPVEVVCDTCGKAETFLVNRARFTAWYERRMLIQDALAHLSIPDREFVKSRICPACWTGMFGSGPFHP
ncbi:hypothetical protein [Nocardia transvalensis]|uniref:hypothetical protein n=1 Tax=Nocardia transvalensis TaxID=37333 RepID=UPI001895E54E|nr:hypothetical protein [Nocardia transvalensis]MBF6333159.1 hypothetical protein [Nocardia transvalensis]